MHVFRRSLFTILYTAITFVDRRFEHPSSASLLPWFFTSSINSLFFYLAVTSPKTTKIMNPGYGSAFGGVLSFIFFLSFFLSFSRSLSFDRSLLLFLSLSPFRSLSASPPFSQDKEVQRWQNGGKCKFTRLRQRAVRQLDLLSRCIIGRSFVDDTDTQNIGCLCYKRSLMITWWSAYPGIPVSLLKLLTLP